MHEQNVAGGEVGEEILGAPAEAGHGLAFEALREILAERPAQIAAARFDLGEARAFHDRREAAAHGLDFGKFGHRSCPPASRSNLVNFRRHSAALASRAMVAREGTRP